MGHRDKRLALDPYHVIILHYSSPEDWEQAVTGRPATEKEVCDGKIPEHTESPEKQADNRGGGGAPQAGLRLQRGAGTRPLPPARRLPRRRPLEVHSRISLAPASGHRDDHLRPGGPGGARGQHEEQGGHRARRRAVDDGGKRHHPPGDAERQPERTHGGLSALGKSAEVSQDDGSPLSGGKEKGDSRGDPGRRNQGPGHLRHDGQGDRPGPGHRHRARVPRRVHAG